MKWIVYIGIFVLMFNIAFAFNGSSSNYSIDSTHLGSAGSVGESSTFGLRATTTFEQGGSPYASTTTYSMNIGHFYSNVTFIPTFSYGTWQIATGTGMAHRTGDPIKAMIQLRNASNIYISDKFCEIMVRYPDNSVWINWTTMSEITGSTGVYYYDINESPSIEGIYGMEYKCYEPATSQVKAYAFENIYVSPWANQINNISVSLTASVSSIQSQLTDILNNQSTIFTKLVQIDNNITTSYAQLLNLENQIQNTNETLYTGIIYNRNVLLDINATVTTILNQINSVVIPQINLTLVELDNIDVDLEEIMNATDNLTQGQTNIINTINGLEVTIGTLNVTIAGISDDIDALNISIENRFDTIDSTLTNVSGEIDILQAMMDCNVSNEICNNLAVIDVRTDFINYTVNNIEDFLLGNMTNVLDNVSGQLDDTYNLLLVMNGTINDLDTSITNITSTQVQTLIDKFDSAIIYKLEAPDRVISSDDYLIQATYTNLEGVPIDPDVTPTITLIDPLSNIVINNVPMTGTSTGVYEYSYTTSSSSNPGNWFAMVSSEHNNETFFQFDYWHLISNPTQITVDVTDVSTQLVCADITIQNEGTTPFEYIYYWWNTLNPLEDYSGTGVGDRGQASKLLQAGEIWTINYCLDVIQSNSTQYYRAKVWYGEYSFATDSYLPYFYEDTPYFPQAQPGEQEPEVIEPIKEPVGIIEEIEDITGLKFPTFCILLVIVGMFGVILIGIIYKNKPEEEFPWQSYGGNKR